MLTPDDIGLNNFAKVVRVGTTEQGSITAITNVTPDEPGGVTMVVLVLWDGSTEPEAIELPSDSIALLQPN